VKNCEIVENKGEFENFIQSERVENCAISDAVAQLKMKWRNFGDTFESKKSRRDLRGRETLKEKLKS
jgi:hypothetical protein